MTNRKRIIGPALALVLFSGFGVASAAPRLPEGTEIRVRTESDLTSKTAEVGDTVYLRVSDPVRYNGRVVIPDGARVTGRISEARHRGVFGRSGKLEITVDSVKVGEGSIRLRGARKNSGKGQGTLSITTAVLVAPVAGIITGKSAVIKQGTEFIVYTDQDY
jgi:hypothetical protein